MKKDFKEEQKALKNIIKNVDVERNEIKNQIQKYQEKVDEGYYGYDGHDIWIDNKKTLETKRNRLLEMDEIRRKIYFGRFDVDEIKGSDIVNSETCYVGDTTVLLDKSNQKVYDWRTSFGNIYYVSQSLSQNEFKINGKQYRLLLRRALSVDADKLNSCSTTYDSYENGISGDVVDEYLIDVLKDKRRDRTLSDIIRTIQYDQNEIMRQPANKNFVVQGCAGSGKTMILLHRLSYLLFNKLYSPQDIKVITPNRFFDAQIDDLSRGLGIHEIDRLTVDEYYKYLIRSINKQSLAKPVSNENVLNHEMLTEIYSEDLNRNIRNEFQKQVDKIINSINQSGVNSILAKSGILVSTLNLNKLYGVYNAYNSKLSDFVSTYTSSDKLLELEDKVKDLREKTQSLKAELLDDLYIELAEIDTTLADSQKDRKSFEERKQVCVDLINEYEAKILSTSVNKDEILTYAYLSEQDNEITQLIKESCKEEFSRIAQMSEKIKKIPFYNFVKRNQEQAKLDVEIQSFIASAKVVLDNYISNIENEDYTGKKAIETKRLVSIDKRLKEIVNSIADFTQQKEQMNTFFNLIVNESDVNSLLMHCTSFKNICNEKYLSLFKDLATELQQYTSNINQIKDNYLNRKDRIDVSSITKEEYEVANRIRLEVQRCSFANVYRRIIIDKLNSIYEDYNFESNDELYRHNLYLQLLASILYFGRTRLSDKLICIDEAQDLSALEYELFLEMNDSKCVYNLYGDINQVVFDYESISDWADIGEDFETNVYILNQNYRNTLQITEYCNKEFGSQILPIGIKGDQDVDDSLSLEEAVIKIKDIKSSDPSKRCAVIYKGNNEEVKYELEVYASVYDLNWNIMDNSSVSVLSVAMVKGIEFDTVLVVTDGMSVNEKYISYTRALEELIVCKIL